jgi:hypothetical protein
MNNELEKDVKGSNNHNHYSYSEYASAVMKSDKTGE